MLASPAGSWSFVTAVVGGKPVSSGRRNKRVEAASAGVVHAAFNVLPSDAFNCHQC